MTSYYKVMLGRASAHASECFDSGFLGADFGIGQDLTGNLPDAWKAFNAKFIPVFLATHPDKSKVQAGLACGALWTIARGLRPGDLVLSPDGAGRFRVGEVTGEYYYAPGQVLPHRRHIAWRSQLLERTEMSDPLVATLRAIGTVTNISSHAVELSKLIFSAPPPIIATDASIEDALAFAVEKHLEDFLVQNWNQTDLGKEFDLFSEDGELTGQQFRTDTGAIDILAISKDRKRLLVIELKKGRASDAVVGQVLRYMGYMKEEWAEDYQSVEGAIIALEDDQRIRRALSAVSNVRFYRYRIGFQLISAQA